MDTRPTTVANVGADPDATCQRDCQSEESFRQWVGHSLWKAKHGLVGSFSEEIPQGIIIDITPSIGAWVKEATATFHERQIYGFDTHAYDWRYSHSRSCQPTGRSKCECKLAKPPNFKIEDRELNLLFDKNSVAFVNVQDTYLWLRDEDILFDHIAYVLQPGGWLQLCETRLSGWNCDKPEVNQWRDHVIACARTLGCGLSSSVDVRKSLEKRGFGDYRMSGHTWQTFAYGTKSNGRVLLLWKSTVNASRQILVEGGFGSTEAVDKLIEEVLLKLDEPDLRALIPAHSCFLRKLT
jgi:hypothetical protein